MPEPTVPESAWFKSSYSSGEGGECVEVASTPGTVHVRDSKDLTGPVLTVSPEAWSGLVGLVSGRSA
ncbi:DUF397 domain-containing protein [Streptomyces sp. DH37]|uniref:DUF397 domain-containing protein n=1 Tax=Streptomyces sp. DH37 TaxID=3040122 RepID=UPI002441FAC5|nr:DUF397 domain-containing protein [Streptomyces sp. DH37]MDG9705423.1 DUF397 domain-containing protein [Streptomyces sp. DH37]